MVNKIIEGNTFNYPMIMTVSKKHKLEKPSVFEEIGFKVNLDKNDFSWEKEQKDYENWDSFAQLSLITFTEAKFDISLTLGLF